MSTVTLAFSKPPCRDVTEPVARILSESILYAAAINALSMRDFVPGSESGHDHFFSTFDGFAPAAQNNGGEMFAEVALRAASQLELYLELMISPGMERTRALGDVDGWDDDFDALSTRLFRTGLRDVVKVVQKIVDESEREQREILRCNETAARIGCGVVIRYIAQVDRNAPSEQVFAQTLLAFLLSSSDRRFVGVNFVGSRSAFILGGISGRSTRKSSKSAAE